MLPASTSTTASRSFEGAEPHAGLDLEGRRGRERRRIRLDRDALEDDLRPRAADPLLPRNEAPQRLAVGQTWTLDDGTKLEFLGTRQFATLAVRYDPTQPLVLGGAVLGLLGLMLSLAGHRRRTGPPSLTNNHNCPVLWQSLFGA